MPSKVEGILELIIEHECFYAKRGSLDITPNCYHPLPYPIAYSKESKWMDEIRSLKDDLFEFLESSDIISAIDWIDLFLSENFSKLPILLGQNLKYIRHNVLPLFDGNTETIEKSFLFLMINNSVENTLLHWAIRVDDGIDILSKAIKEVPDELSDDLFSCLKTLRKNRKILPSIPLDFEKMPDFESKDGLSQDEYSGEPEIIESFQNRGSDIDQVRNFLANAENKVVIVTGSIGIGKSSFINWMFKKQFGDWEVLRVYIAKEARAPRLLAEIGYLVGMPLDIDSLSTVTTNVFRQIVRKIFTAFYQKQKRALVIDDLNDVLKAGTARDHNQLSIIIEEAASKSGQHIGGRIFIVSSQWLPWKWINQPGVAHLPLKRINDIYTRRIIEYHMRRCNLIVDESIPEPPQELIDLVNGHPLSAKIVVDALKDKNFKELSDSLRIDEISGYVAGILLKHVSLSNDEKECLQLLSVFRRPIELNILKKVTDTTFVNTIDSLQTRCILSYDGRYLEMHEAVRRYFVKSIQKDKNIHFHKIAATYYQYKYENENELVNKNPNVVAEFVHHLSFSDQVEKAKELRILIIEELKPTARKFYKDLKQYSKAFDLYRLLNRIVPDDIEVLAYIGRCSARLGQWNASDQAFQSAIEVARRTGQQVWWLYRDWGHIKARFSYFTEAKEYFEKAAHNRPNDPSIKSSLAYMHWRQNENDLARELFEEVINDYPYHKYTLTFYSRFLEENDENEYAKSLKDRLFNLEYENEYHKPIEFDIDEDYDD